MRISPTALIAALAVIAVGCSQTNPVERPPIVIAKTITVELPPEARKATPPNSPKPVTDISDLKTFELLSEARTSRNVCEHRRSAAVAAVDAANGSVAP